MSGRVDGGSETGGRDEPRTGQQEEPSSRQKPKRRRRSVHEERLGGKRPGDEMRVPAWVVIPLAVGAGALVAEWPGAIFGLLAGLALWWSRR